MSNRTMMIAWVGCVLAVGGCDDTAADADADREPLGKADAVGSCEQTNCDGQAPSGNCFCDDECVEFDDCCSDHVAACGGPHACAPQQAVGLGACNLLHGFAWNGSTCVTVAGCSCDGEDCAALASRRDDCITTFGECTDDTGDDIPSQCEAQHAQGLGMCSRLHGFAWNGEQCVAVAGCSCSGTDCVDLPIAEQACVDAHSGC